MAEWSGMCVRMWGGSMGIFWGVIFIQEEASIPGASLFFVKKKLPFLEFHFFIQEEPSIPGAT